MASKPFDPPAAAAAAALGAAEDDADEDSDTDDDSAGIQLVAHPLIVPSSFARIDPDRFDRICLYRLRKPKKKKRALTSDDGVVAASTRSLDDNSKDGRTATDEVEPEPRYTVTVVDRGSTAAAGGGGGGNHNSPHHGTVAFLIPAGREAEFMFSTLPGLRAVLESANCDRLLAVATGRDHAYKGGTSQIQQELQRVCQILHYRGTPSRSSTGGARSSRNRNNPHNHSRRPPDVVDDDEASRMIPFVTTSEGVGEREIVARGTSELSGEYVVEQVKLASSEGGGGGGDANGDANGGGVVARRLYFLSNPFVIQSEVCLRHSTIDPSEVAFEYHRAMVSCLALAWHTTSFPRASRPHNAPFNEDTAPPPSTTTETISPPTTPQGLLLGLGGGGLLHYARRVLPQATWVAVELDPEVARVARQHFGVEELIRSGHVDVRIGNGLGVRAAALEDDTGKADEDAARAEPPISHPELPAVDATTTDDDGLAFAAHSLSFIVVDVDSKDNSVGMSCPPSEFVLEGYLRTLARLLVEPAETDQHHRRCGVLVVNVSARDKSLFHEACRSIGAVFSHVFASLPDDDSVNVVVVASMHELPFIVNAPSSQTSSQQQQRSSWDRIGGSDVFQTELPEEELRSLFDALNVWNPLSDANVARANEDNNKKKNKKKNRGKKRR